MTSRGVGSFLTLVYSKIKARAGTALFCSGFTSLLYLEPSMGWRELSAGGARDIALARNVPADLPPQGRQCVAVLQCF